ncbi:hypothetical protein AJ79_06824 [Helicocarpus griseus UAMH5409]|uniref:Uncharacterized protein n=1 Tax=Helicocarpus griseus UAMH5409 TaxID=1447875 RepID=A0A2B7X8S2_9EURO|nr:hypothetical protein AJ79_06824 [Helicocarpus griseus UAMH5409]
MPSESSIQQSLLDTIERSFYHEVPTDSQEPENQKADDRPREKGSRARFSNTSYEPHPITPETLVERTATLQAHQPHQQHHHHYEVHGRPTTGLMFMLRWACAILTVAATILFGAWAPLSYEATKEANRNNNKAQEALVESAQSANKIASKAFSMASAQANIISNLQEQLAAMGQVALLQFCNEQTRGELEPCAAFINSVQLTSLVSKIATPTSTMYPPTATSDDDLPTSISDDSSANGSGLPIASILGIVFGGTAALGIAIGYLVWRYQHGRLVAPRRFR